MKTVDLIPLILLELNSGDKYGLEITKNIENRSGARIIIKQPTLYTILKKLEKSKFISSYWLDSDIGGKRHYYKLTENGKLQAQTLPNYNVVIENILAEEEETNQPTLDENQPEEAAQPIEQDTAPTQVSIMDVLDVSERETILPSQEVFSLNSIDNSTEADINKQNTSILKSETENKQEKFANNQNVSSFASKKEALISSEYKDSLKTIYENTNKKYTEYDNANSTLNYSNINYVDFVDLKQNAAYLRSKRTAKNLGLKIMCSCIYLVLALALTAISIHITAKPYVYYAALVCGCLGLVLYPIVYALNIQKWRLNWEEHPYIYNLKRGLIVTLIVMLLTLVVTLVLNLTIIKTSFTGMFNIKNFANFYAPIIISAVSLFDVIIGYIFMVKLNK